MKIIGQLIDEVIEEIPRSLLKGLLAKKLALQGIRVSDRKLKTAVKQILNGDTPSVRFWGGSFGKT